MDPLDEIIKQINEINARINTITELLRIEHIAEETEPDA